MSSSQVKNVLKRNLGEFRSKTFKNREQNTLIHYKHYNKSLQLNIKLSGRDRLTFGKNPENCFIDALFYQKLGRKSNFEMFYRHEF